MKRIGLILLVLFVYNIGNGQVDSLFLETIGTMNHRMQHPGVEDLGMPLENLDPEWDRHILEDFYDRIIQEKKEYIESQIGKVDSELIFQQLIYNKFSEEELYRLRHRFDPIDFSKPFGRQVKKITDYVDKKKKSLGNYFPQLEVEDSTSLRVILPSIPSDKFILLHFWTSYCNNCKEKNVYFQENESKFLKNNIVVVNICTDYFPRNWKKLMSEKDYQGTQYYMNRRSFMEIAADYTLELSSTLLLDYTYTIVQRDMYKLENLIDKATFK